MISLKCMRLEREVELKMVVFVPDDGAPAPSNSTCKLLLLLVSVGRLAGAGGFVPLHLRQVNIIIRFHQRPPNFCPEKIIRSEHCRNIHLVLPNVLSCGLWICVHHLPPRDGMNNSGYCLCN